MGKASATGRLVARHVGPRVPHLAPDLTHTFVREALHRAIEGAGPLAPAARAAEKTDVPGLIEDHVRYAGAQGLLTGLGGIVTATVTIPANVAGLALIQSRMVAGIAHLRGYDLEDPRARNAILACLLGRELVDQKIRERKLPGPPMAIATAPVHDPDLDRVISAEVASDLITRVGGKRLAIAIARRTPIVGGAFGMGADGLATWRVGRYAAGELRPRTSR
ncbi:EcsC family protein [Nocardioides pyridinolyticus]